MARRHTADEFGRPTSGKMTGVEPPMIGASSLMMVDGIVEQQTGKTPPPPAVTVRMIVVALVVMFLLSLVGLKVIGNHPTEPQVRTIQATP